MSMRFQKSRRGDKRDFHKGNRVNGRNFAYANVMRGGYRL